MEPETNKFQQVPRSEAVDERPARVPIPSIVRRDPATATASTKPAPAFTWPLATAKPREPGPWKPPARPIAPAVKVPAQLAPMTRVPRATAPPPVEPVRIEPVHVEPEPEPVQVAAVHIEPVRVEPEPEPVQIEPAREVVREAPAFGASMLHARKKSASIDVPSTVSASTTFGAGMLQARKGNGKLLVIAVIFVVAAIGGLVVVRGGSSAKAAPVPTAQP